MLAVTFVLCATLTLLPLVLFKLDHRINKLALKWVHTGEHRSPKFAAWGERLWKRPIAFGLASLIVLLALAAPVLGLKTAMPSIQVLPEEASARVGYDQVKDAFGEGAPGILQVIADRSDAKATTAALTDDAGIAGAMPAQPAADDSDLVLIQAVPTVDPSDPELGATVDRLRDNLPESALVGGAAVENLDLKNQLDESTPLVIGVVLALGFLLLLVALQAPLISLLGTLASLLSTAAAFGVARMVFQERHRRGPARVRVPGLPRRLGPGFLLRDDLRDRDGLHRLPAGLRPRSTTSARATHTRPWSAHWPTPVG